MKPLRKKAGIGWSQHWKKPPRVGKNTALMYPLTFINNLILALWEDPTAKFLFLLPKFIFNTANFNDWLSFHFVVWRKFEYFMFCPGTHCERHV